MNNNTYIFDNTKTDNHEQSNVSFIGILPVHILQKG